jgi:mannose-6-phosphate isomerase
MFPAAPANEPIGEAWVLSDQGENQSVVSEGPWAGTTLRQLLEQVGDRILGKSVASHKRFPILLKFIHAREPLSVQVHPTDAKARQLEGPDAVGKTEAWFIMQADPTARLYTGLPTGVTPERLRAAIASETVENFLYAHAPAPGDCVFLSAGTVHSIGGGLVLFEIQQTSDITYRLYDWGRTDPKTGKRRELHIEKALASINYSAGPCRPVYPTSEEHGRIRLTPLVECEHFTLGRWESSRPFRAGLPNQCRVLVGISGRATLTHAGVDYPISLGDVLLLPAEVGMCECVPHGAAVILECGLPG